MSSFLTSAGSDFTYTPRMTRSQRDIKLTKTNKLTCMCSELAIDSVFLATKSGGILSGFPSTVHFTFGYVRYCIRSISAI